MAGSASSDEIQALEQEIASLTEQLPDETDAESRASIIEQLEVDRALLAELRAASERPPDA